MTKGRRLSARQRERLLELVQERFIAHSRRHRGVDWEAFRDRLLEHPTSLRALNAMESTGGEPDVVGRDRSTGEFVVMDCSEQSPAGRRSLCYDQAALRSRKRHPPAGNVLDTADSIGITLATVDEYHRLQKLGEFDTTTSSWVLTPRSVRQLGGALFCDRRYGEIFTYHNGAESYYTARGFRGVLRI